MDAVRYKRTRQSETIDCRRLSEAPAAMCLAVLPPSDQPGSLLSGHVPPGLAAPTRRVGFRKSREP